MDVDEAPATTAPPANSSEEATASASASAATSAAAPSTAAQFAAQARARAKAAADARKQAAAAAKASATAAADASSPLSAISGDEEMRAPSDEDDLPDLDFPVAARTRRSGATTATATEDEDAAPAETLSVLGTRRSTRREDAQHEAQMKQAKTLTKNYGGTGKYGLAALAREKATEPERIAREEEMARRAAAILEEPEPELLFAPSPKKRKPGVPSSKRRNAKSLEKSMQAFTNETSVAKEQGRTAAVQMLREELDNVDDLEEQAREAALERRRFWEECLDEQQTCPPYLAPGLPSGASRFVQGIRTALQRASTSPHGIDPRACPNQPGAVDRQEAASVIPWLLDLASHPLLPTELAEASLLVLFNTLEQAAGTPKQRKEDPALMPISLATIEAAFFRLGARSATAGARRNGHTPSNHVAAIEQGSFDGDQRVLRTNQILAALERAGKIGAWSAPSDDTIGIILLVARLLLDPEGQPFRDTGSAALQALVHSLFLRSQTLLQLFGAILAALADRHRQEQHYVLFNLPHRLPEHRRFRRWLAYALLTKSTLESLQASGVSLSSTPPYQPLIELSKYKRAHSPFYLRRPLDDCALYFSACLLQFALADLTVELADEAPNLLETRKALRTLSDRLARLQSAIPTDAQQDTPFRTRAKNTVVQISHSLIYQLPEVHNRLEDEILRAALEEQDP